MRVGTLSAVLRALPRGWFAKSIRDGYCLFLRLTQWWNFQKTQQLWTLNAESGLKIAPVCCKYLQFSRTLLRASPITFKIPNQIAETRLLDLWYRCKAFWLAWVKLVLFAPLTLPAKELYWAILSSGSQIRSSVLRSLLNALEIFRHNLSLARKYILSSQGQGYHKKILWAKINFMY